MEMLIYNVYSHFGLQRPPEAGAGTLRVWDAATPENVSAKRLRPGILILPGGGSRHTSPREAEPVALRFLALGYVPFVLDYSCAPSGYPTALREAAMAMRFIRENAARFEVNPQMVAAIGFSAGGICAGVLAHCMIARKFWTLLPRKRCAPTPWDCAIPWPYPGEKPTTTALPP